MELLRSYPFQLLLVLFSQLELVFVLLSFVFLLPWQHDQPVAALEGDFSDILVLFGTSVAEFNNWLSSFVYFILQTNSQIDEFHVSQVVAHLHELLRKIGVISARRISDFLSKRAFNLC